MRREFEPGDRVRVSRRSRVPSYQEGEKGTVTDGPRPYPNGAVHYLVALEAVRELWFSADFSAVFSTSRTGS